MNIYKREYDQKILYELFITQNLSAQKIANKYNIPRYVVESDLNKYNIRKPKELANKSGEKDIDKEELYQYYIVQKHTMKECAEHFNVYESTISRRCRLYNFNKSSEEINAPKLKDIGKEELYQYYIIENHSTEECAEHFKVHERTVRRRIKKYEIQKSVEQQVLCSKKAQEEKYGSLFTQSEYYKNNVVDKMVEKGKQTCLKRYGVESWTMTEDGIKSRSYKYCYEGLKFDSSWELALYIYAIDSKEDIKREPVKLEYFINNVLHYYVPDFLYKGELVEIKGDHLIKGGNLNNVYKKSSFKDKAKQECMVKNGVKIMLYKDIKFALDYVKESYGKDYLKKFKIR